MPAEAAEGLGAFLDSIWRDTQAFVYIATKQNGDPKSFAQYMLPWPAKRAGIIKHILSQTATGADVYYSPALYREQGRPVKDNVLGSWVQWADFDSNAPGDWTERAAKAGIPEPSIRVQSSVPGNEHVYWQLNELQTNRESLEEVNRAIAYRLGADTSGWDADQLLRPPYTYNFGHKDAETRKVWFSGEPAPVVLQSSSNSRQISPEEFKNLGSPEREYLSKIQLGVLPPLSAVLALAKWSDDFFAHFSMSKEEAAASSPDKRSGALMKLGYYAVENGLTDEQIYVVLDDADRRWDKYIAQHSKAGRHKILLDTIARARAKLGYVTEDSLTFAGLLMSSPTETAPRVPVYSFSEFLAHDIKLEWLIEGLLVQGGLTTITGQPGVGKTQWGLQLCIDLARGAEKFLTWNSVCGPKKVLFLSLEMPHAPLKSFIEKMARQYEDDMVDLTRNMYIAPVGAPVPLDTTQGQQFFDVLLSEYQPDILFIDSLQKISGKPLTDEQAAKDLAKYINKIRLSYGTSVIIVHHNRKRSADSKSSGDLNEMFGSQFLAAELDAVINLRRITNRLVAVDCWKSRLDIEWPSFDIERNDNLQYELYTGQGAVYIGPDNGEETPHFSF